ncbi:hypothetical protein E2C01_089504 [Portunus trituberculatus]|uniref:Uncharacterized protein n=1 Tax=Portunus trituberculatus TaxID=210409 RepID=A0A5B7JC75_PORTR|nr:hypothetical protein [Portunus trituberculatus]
MGAILSLMPSLAGQDDKVINRNDNRPAKLAPCVLPCHTPPRSLTITIRPPQIGFVSYQHAQREPLVAQGGAAAAVPR